MSTDEFSTEMELYGVDPGIIRMIMFLVTILFPFGFISGYTFFLLPGFYWLVWILFSPYFYLPLCLLNILFAHRIVRYYRGRSSKNTVHLIGLLSLLLPTAIVCYISSLSGYLVIIYPVPIQYVIGLVLLHRIEGPEVISPWSGLRLDLSWWKWRQSKRKSDWDPFEKERRTPEQA
ncbi:MAG: hypothetical protein ACFFCP_00150 [Promethearchaeota archaeon]